MRWAAHTHVPENSTNLAFGILLSGAGQAWIDDVTFTVVSADVLLTGAKQSKNFPVSPQSLDFEK